MRNNSLLVFQDIKSIFINWHQINQKCNVKYAISISNNKKMTGINEQHFHGENYNVLLKEFLIST